MRTACRRIAPHKRPKDSADRSCDEKRKLSCIRLTAVPVFVVPVMADRRRPPGEYVDRLPDRHAASVGQHDGERVRLRVEQLPAGRHHHPGPAARAEVERGARRERARSSRGGYRSALPARTGGGHVITVAPRVNPSCVPTPYKSVCSEKGVPGVPGVPSQVRGVGNRDTRRCPRGVPEVSRPNFVHAAGSALADRGLSRGVLRGLGRGLPGGLPRGLGCAASSRPSGFPQLRPGGYRLAGPDIPLCAPRLPDGREGRAGAARGFLGVLSSRGAGAGPPSREKSGHRSVPAPYKGVSSEMGVPGVLGVPSQVRVGRDRDIRRCPRGVPEVS